MYAVRKWNPDTKTFEPYIVPHGRICPLFTNDDTKINCISCGATIKFKEGYPSLTYQDKAGLGYQICESCAKQEMKQSMDEKYPIKKEGIT